MSDGNGYLKISQARWIIGILVFIAAAAISWMALDLDRHEDQAAHVKAAEALAVAATERGHLQQDINRRLSKLERDSDRDREHLRRIETLLAGIKIKLNISTTETAENDRPR